MSHSVGVFFCESTRAVMGWLTNRVVTRLCFRFLGHSDELAVRWVNGKDIRDQRCTIWGVSGFLVWENDSHVCLWSSNAKQPLHVMLCRSMATFSR